MRVCSPALLIVCLLKLSPVLAGESIPVEVQQIPSDMITPSALELRGTMPIDVNNTEDSIFAVDGICKSPGVIAIRQYAIASFERSDLAIQHCERFGGPSITAIGNDDSKIYIKFGLDSEQNAGDHNNLAEFSLSGPNLLVLDRYTHRELASYRTKYWMELIDASGSTIIGCGCPYGGYMESPNSTECVEAPKGAARLLHFSKLSVASARGKCEAHGLSRIFDSGIPSGWWPVAAGTAATVKMLAVTRLRGHDMDLALFNTATRTLQQIATLPAALGERANPAVHLYSDWLIAAQDDTVVAYHLQSPTRLYRYEYQSTSHATIGNANLYGSRLVLRVFSPESGELQSLQIDLQELLASTSSLKTPP